VSAETIIETKVCVGKGGCGQAKPLREFNRNGRNPAGEVVYRHVCRACEKQREHERAAPTEAEPTNWCYARAAGVAREVAASEAMARRFGF
jgi:hypothetical protein